MQFGADLASVLDDGNKLRVLPIVGRGSVQSVADILFLQGVDLGIVRADTLDYLERKGFAKDIKKQFTYVTKLYNEEMHVIASKSVHNLKELDGKTISVDLPNGGTFVTALTMFERLGMKPKVVYIEQRIAMEKMRAGEIDAVIVVGGKPYKSVGAFKDDRFHMVTVDYYKPLQADYLPATLTAADYPNLISKEEGRSTRSRCRRCWRRIIGRPTPIVTASSLCSSMPSSPNFPPFQNPPFHPKWKEVSLSAPLAGLAALSGRQAMARPARRRPGRARQVRRVPEAKSGGGQATLGCRQGSAVQPVPGLASRAKRQGAGPASVRAFQRSMPSD